MHLDPGSAKKTLHLVIHGRVQGVYFRESMRLEAQSRAVAGWVRNCADGTVEALVHGDSAGVDALVRWAHQGPAAARVERVEIVPAAGSYATFEVLR